MKTKLFLSLTFAGLVMTTACKDCPPADTTAADIAAKNKKVVEATIAAFSTGNEAAIDTLLADNFKNNTPDPSLPFSTEGKEGQKNLTKMYHQMFPDMKITINQVTAEGDMVAIWWTGSGTHTGAMEGMPASGKAISVSGSDLYKLANGKVTEGASVFDEAGMLEQMGMMIVPAALAGEEEKGKKGK